MVFRQKWNVELGGICMIELKEIKWDDFDYRKKREGGDTRYFSFSDWEIDFIVGEMRQLYPQYNEVIILRALLKCCEAVQLPYPKEDLYQCVLNRLEDK